MEIHLQSEGRERNEDGMKEEAGVKTNNMLMKILKSYEVITQTVSLSLPSDLSQCVSDI